MPLRELIYLDRERVESYVSQLSGGVTVEVVSSTSNDRAASGRIKAGVKFIELEAAANKGSARGLTSTRVPAHAILATLEELLCRDGLLVDARSNDVSPGQIAFVVGDTTFESWEILATLADSIQGIATLAAKLYGAHKGNAEAAEIRQMLAQLDKLLKRYGPKSEFDEAKEQLASRVSRLKTGYEIVDSGYIDDVRNIIKLFFQDQNHVRIATDGSTFVGLLRRDGLVGSTMEELLFTYGSKPSLPFTAIFYVAEPGRDEGIRLEDLSDRLMAVAGGPASFATLQEPIRQFGSCLLESAEDLRRPIGTNTILVVPLAIYREIEPPAGPDADTFPPPTIQRFKYRFMDRMRRRARRDNH